MINHIKVNLNDYAAEEAPLTGINNKVINNIVTTIRHPNIKSFKAFQLEKLRQLVHPRTYTLMFNIRRPIEAAISRRNTHNT